MIEILFIEDHEDLRKALKKQLELFQFRVDEAQNYRAASRKIGKKNYDIILLDLILPDGNGLKLFDEFPGKLNSRTIIITANATIPSVVEAIKKGAFNYLEKPVELPLLLAQVKKIIEMNRLRSEHQSLRSEVISNYTFDDIVFQSNEMADIVDRAKVLAETENTILIQGETGVGKEVISQAIHYFSRRKGNPFLPVNCAAIPSELFESELFGFEKGAFTGAIDSYSGRFIQADQGTLFLDEIGELPLHIQAKLLRVLDEKVIYRLKSKQTLKIDVRLVVATNKNLEDEVKLNQFRSDLYYRLIESTITIPPLRERFDDILPLAYYFIRKYNQIYNKNVTRISDEAEKFLVNYPWPGNIRELKNTIKSIFPFKKDNTIGLDDLSYSIIGGKKFAGSKFLSLEEYMNKYIQKILKVSRFNICHACEILKISRPRLYRKIKDLKIENVVKEK